LIIPALFLLISACIGWSSDQKEVVESYNTLMSNASDENWSSLSRGLSDETIELLDEIAVLYTAAGVPFDNQGKELLASLVSDTDLLAFSETVISIEFRNGKAYLLSGQGNMITSYQFVRENQRWKLNLVPKLNEFLSEIMEGTPEVNPNSQSTTSPTYISAGTGTCEFSLRNNLEHLSILNVYCSPSNSDSWGEDWLGSSILGTSKAMTIWLEEGVYDIQLMDSDQNTYTLWQVELDDQGVFWQVTELDRDESN
ncbi:MAG: hypothetical protein KAH31_12430, partial [Candidatus Sabulitectum sp.]|nr:hypothetical protein [Candidatus Sabulitectum sp.]